MAVNKKILVFLPFVAYAFFPKTVLAADTCCVGHGGDYSCNYQTSQLYCQDGTVSNQCTCQASPTATPTPTPVPTAIPIESSAPACPENASFNASSNACACSSGYVVSNNACVTYDAYCQSQYGNNAGYNSGSNACACTSGYTWNSGGTACVTMDTLCNEKIGNNSYYNSSDNSCYCYSGYSIQNGACQVMPTPIPPATIAPTTGVPIVVPTPVVIPTLAGVVVPTHAPTPIKVPVKKSPVKFNLNKKVPGLNGFVAVRKKPQGFFDTIITAIVDALKKAFNI